MKVLLICGSPHANGCTHTALTEVEAVLQSEGVETEEIWIGNKPIAGCSACGSCAKTGKCIYDDLVNQIVEKVNEADGFIFAAPVYYASPNGNFLSFMDRLFYMASQKMEYKPAAAIVSARRGGTTASLDVLNKYMQFNNMPIVSSRYWNMVHGSKPEDVKRDEEGLQIMRYLGRNMAWMLKCIQLGKENGMEHPHAEEVKIFTNFIRPE